MYIHTEILSELVGSSFVCCFIDAHLYSRALVKHHTERILPLSSVPSDQKCMIVVFYKCPSVHISREDESEVSHDSRNGKPLPWPTLHAWSELALETACKASCAHHLPTPPPQGKEWQQTFQPCDTFETQRIFFKKNYFRAASELGGSLKECTDLSISPLLLAVAASLSSYREWLRALQGRQCSPGPPGGLYGLGPSLARSSA